MNNILKKSKAFLIILAICLCSCSNAKNKINQSSSSSNQFDNSNAATNNKNKSSKIQSKYTGLCIDEESYNRIAFMAIIENSTPSRPQSGISYADIIYETMAEGGITRFVALFQSKICNKIGPIRSVRPYLLDLAKEYNLPIAHCGGSKDALIRVKKGNDMNINEMSHSDLFSRDNSRKPPHNLYTSSKKIIEYCKRENYIKDNNIKFNFDDKYWQNNNLQEAKSITLKLNKYYSTNYNFKGKNYVKSMDGVQCIDPINNEPVTADNIVIQIANILSTNDTLHHVKIDLTGSGKGYLISKGKCKKITWNKNDISSQTIIMDNNNNNIVPLSKGKTWWHIVDNSCIINIK